MARKGRNADVKGMRSINRNKRGERRIRGVRIACYGERVVGVQEFKAYDIPLYHDVFDMGELSQVSKLVGMPLLVSKVRPSMEFAASQDTYGCSIGRHHNANRAVARLMMCCEREATTSDGEQVSARLLDTFARWCGAGSVVVVRADKKPLEPYHVSSLLRYVNHVSTIEGPEAAELVGARTRNGIGELVLGMFTPGDFKEYYRSCEPDEDGKRALAPLLRGGVNKQLPKSLGEKHRFWALSVEAKMRAAETRREMQYVCIIAELRERLNENPVVWSAGSAAPAEAKK